MTTPPRRRATARIGTGLRRTTEVAAARLSVMFGSRGVGFQRLAEAHAGNTAGDTLVAIALAGTLFFDVPSAQARDNVLLYLGLTLAPFSVVGPFLGAMFERFPGAYRRGLILSSGARAIVAVFMIVGLSSLWLFPLAFVLLVLSRIHGIARSSILPVLLDRPIELVSANAALARIGVFGTAVALPLGGLAALLGPALILLFALAAFGFSAMAAVMLPTLAPGEAPLRPPRRERRGAGVPQPVRLSRFATAVVRFLNGFLLLLVAFAFRDQEAGIFDFGALLAAAGLGYLVASFLAPALERRLAEEPMVVSALALEAAAAFVAALYFGLPAAAFLAGAAGLAWGMAKLGFDGLLQATVPPERRGRAFTQSETLFQIAWVIGAIVPVAITIPDQPGLLTAGLAALFAQVVYVAALLLPIARERRRPLDPPEPDPGAVTDLI